jgi:hypothetical protein
VRHVILFLSSLSELYFFSWNFIFLGVCFGVTMVEINFF